MCSGPGGRKDGPPLKTRKTGDRGRRGRGFSLIELLVALIIVALLAGVAVPSYRKIVQEQQVAACIADLRKIGLAIERYQLSHNDAFPMSLDELAMQVPLDPWGRAYRYLNFDAPGAKKEIRKDHNLHPLNSSFDLYSMGPDGLSKSPLTAKASRDDIIWARDGGFIGKATDF